MFRSAEREWTSGRFKIVLNNEPRSAAGEQLEPLLLKWAAQVMGGPLLSKTQRTRAINPT
jgi:hypothetical protein